MKPGFFVCCLVSVGCRVVAGAEALPLVANFDSFSEGEEFVGDLPDGGITFSNFYLCWKFSVSLLPLGEGNHERSESFTPPPLVGGTRGGGVNDYLLSVFFSIRMIKGKGLRESLNFHNFIVFHPCRNLNFDFILFALAN